MNTNRRTFFMTLAASGSVLATSAHAQAKADEKDPQSVALGYVADATKPMPKSTPSTLPVRFVPTVLCIKAKPVMLGVVAHCLPLSKFPAKAGAVLMPKKANGV